jgi:putative intracellular protease/amidase
MNTLPNTVHIAIYPTWADWEPSYLTTRINNPAWQRQPGSFQVRTVADSRQPATSMGGLRVMPDPTFAELKPQDSAMLVLPGGDEWDADPTATENAVRAAQAFLAADVPVAAICGATAGLARAGLLDNRDHTSSAPQYLLYTGGSYAEQLDLFTPEVLDAWYRMFGQQDPSAYAVLAGAQA